MFELRQVRRRNGNLEAEMGSLQEDGFLQGILPRQTGHCRDSAGNIQWEGSGTLRAWMQFPTAKNTNFSTFLLSSESSASALAVHRLVAWQQGFGLLEAAPKTHF